MNPEVARAIAVPPRHRHRARLRLFALTWLGSGLLFFGVSCACGPEVVPPADKYLDLYSPSSTVRRLFYAFETDQLGAAKRCFAPDSSPPGVEDPLARWQALLENVQLDREALRTPVDSEPGSLRLELPCRAGTPPVVFLFQATIFAFDTESDEWIEVTPDRARRYEQLEVDWQILDQASFEASNPVE